MTTPYLLYWDKGTASFAPQALLEETNLDYELITISINAREHKKESYLAINPAGRVPALGLPDGTIIYEAAAIMVYLAEHHKLEALMPLEDVVLRGQFFQSLFYLSNTVQVGYKRFYYPERFSIDANDAGNIKLQSVVDLIACWEPIHIHLQNGGPYLLGERFSFADIYLTMLVTWFEPMDDLLQQYPAIDHCYQLVSRRPAIKKCLQTQNTISVGKL